MLKLKITLIKSMNGRPETQRRTIYGMGLRKLNQSVLLENTPSIKGMIKKVSHLVKAEEIVENEA